MIRKSKNNNQQMDKEVDSFTEEEHKQTEVEESDVTTDKDIDAAGGDSEQKAATSGQESELQEAEPAENVEQKEDADRRKYAELQQQYNELNEKYLRLAAEFDNYKKRKDREFTRRVQYANEEFIREVLPVLDDLERAMEASEDDSSFEELKSGVELVYENFKNILKRRGVEAIDSVGEPFDPDLHDAMMVRESEEHDSEIVLEEFERGYKLGDTVLRHAKVVVSK